jgi:hypothetical protein
LLELFLMRPNHCLLLLFLFVACGTGATRPASVPRPEISLRQAGHIFFGSGTTATATIEVDVKNTASVPLRVRDIEISSPGMVEYALVPTRRVFHQTIAPGETKTLTVLTTAVTQFARLTPSEPLSVRAIVTFDANGTVFRELVRDPHVAVP